MKLSSNFSQLEVTFSRWSNISVSHVWQHLLIANYSYAQFVRTTLESNSDHHSWFSRKFFVVSDMNTTQFKYNVTPSFTIRARALCALRKGNSSANCTMFPSGRAVRRRTPLVTGPLGTYPMWRGSESPTNVQENASFRVAALKKVSVRPSRWVYTRAPPRVLSGIESSRARLGYMADWFSELLRTLSRAKRLIVGHASRDERGRVAYAKKLTKARRNSGACC